MKPDVVETNQSSHEKTTEAKNENSPKRKGVDDENLHGSCKKMRHDWMDCKAIYNRMETKSKEWLVQNYEILYSSMYM